MKRVILLIGVLASVAAAHVVFGQHVEGVIRYEVKTNMHRNLPPERQEMKAMIPEFRTTTDQLFFNATESLYKPVEEDEDEVSGSSGGIQIRMRVPQNEYYMNSETFKKIVLQEFMGKKYLIEDSIKMAPWKFGTEVKTILGYECRQAYFTEEIQGRTLEITAWYTDKIRPFLGPERFNTLPGTVLALDVNNGERLTVARNIELRPLKKNELKIPAGGIKTTQEEYRKMVAEQMERMRSSGGNIIIRN
ncbi:MAG: GLPGLI family protein [Flammeovirgaceae bacterium]|nr:MAG: GLPGLI family protein [Flammeovirgaceae bacterium]